MVFKQHLGMAVHFDSHTRHSLSGTWRVRWVASDEPSFQVMVSVSLVPFKPVVTHN